MNEIVLFTLNGCGHCQDLKKLLDDENIDYTDLEVIENSDIWEDVVKKTSNEFVPTIFININRTNEGPILIPDKDFHSSEEALKIIKKYL